ncbi:IS3 family transposase [Streptomyces humidus]|uniref:IS3 family transposase n=1 Tax=Streptomyces humidus TaxID=52259 RepID=UPI003333025B
MHAVLEREGVHIGRKRAERLMSEAGIAGMSPRKSEGFTRGDGGAELSPGLLQRDLTARAPNRLWDRAVGQFAQPAAVDQPDRLLAQRFQLGPHADAHAQYLADLLGHDRSRGLPHTGADALAVRRDHILFHVRCAVRDQHRRQPRPVRGAGSA